MCLWRKNKNILYIFRIQKYVLNNKNWHSLLKSSRFSYAYFMIRKSRLTKGFLPFVRWCFVDLTWDLQCYSFVFTNKSPVVEWSDVIVDYMMSRVLSKDSCTGFAFLVGKSHGQIISNCNWNIYVALYASTTILCNCLFALCMMQTFFTFIFWI